MDVAQLRGRILSQADVAFLLFLPFLMALLIKSWLYLTPLSWVDPYLYTAYFLDLSKYVEVYGPTYYGSRLPWLLLGSGINSVFSFEVSNLILRFLLFYGSTIPMYVSVRLAWRNRAAALLTAIMMGVTAPFLAAVSWDYPDGAVIAGMCITLALLTAAATTPKRLHALPCLFLAGFVTMMYVSTQLYVVVFAPLPALWFVIMDRTHHKHDLFYSPVTFILGACAGFGLVGLLSNHVGGPFNYLQPQIDAIRALKADAYLSKGSDWINQAGHLTIPALGVLVSVGLAARTFVILVLKRGRYKLMSPDDLTMGFAALMPIGVAAFYLYRYLVVVTPDVQYFFYTSYSLPFVFLAIGAALSLIASSVSDRTKLILAIGGAVVLLAPFASELFRPSEQCFHPQCTFGDEGIKMIVVALLLVLALSLRRIEPAIVGMLVFTVLNIGAADWRFVRFDGNEELLYNQFLQTERVHERLDEYDKDGRLYIWVGTSDDPNIGVTTGVSSLHMFGYRLIANNFPELGSPTGGPTHKIVTGERIAILATRPNVAEEAVATIKSQGFASKVLTSFTDDIGFKPLNVAVVQVELPTDVLPQIELDVSKLGAIPGASVSRDRSGVTVTTQQSRYAYAGLLEIASAVLPTYTGKGGFVRVEGTSGNGYAGIGVLKSDRSGWTITSQFPPKAGKAFDLYLPITTWDDTSDLIVMNWDRDGVSSATISKVTIYVKDVPAAP